MTSTAKTNSEIHTAPQAFTVFDKPSDAQTSHKQNKLRYNRGMKKVLILTDTPVPETTPYGALEQQFRLKLETKLEGQLEIEIAGLCELIYQTGVQTRIWHPKAGYDVADFDAVVVRRVGRYRELGLAVAHYAHSKDIPFSDTYLLTSDKGKLACGFLRALHNLPVPETIYGPAQLLLDNDLVQFPAIVKADAGRAGGDNYLVKDSTEYLRIIEQYSDDMMVTQPYIPNDGDYRIIVLDHKPVLAILRQKIEGNHLNNTSKGGQAELIDLATLPSQLLQHAVRASRLERLQVAGVDIMINKQTGSHVILEVNRAPQLSSGAFVDEKASVYARFLTKLASRTSTTAKQSVAGRAERVGFPECIQGMVDARIDTGAKTSSIWATATVMSDGKLAVTFLGEVPGNLQQGPQYFDTFERTIVANSTGQEQLRYKIRLLVVIGGRRIRGWFTLADRSTQVYPVLIGRNVLKNKFIVDVAQGRPNLIAEKERSKELQIKKER